MLDTFYGLKSEHSITDFGEFFTSTGLFDDLAGTDPLKFDRAIRRLTMKYFDDGHSGMLKYSYLAGPAQKGDEEESLNMFDSIGESSNSKAWEGMRVKGIRSEYYPDHPEIEPYEGGQNPWFYEEIGDTAIITFDEFKLGKTDYYKEADINLDGEADFDDNLPLEINRYIMTSFQSSSCGNLVPTALKDHPNVTLIGRASGGGSCVVRACTTASGTIFTISSPIQISTLKNGSLYNADQGIVPDFTISKYDTFYDREKLVDFIHQLP